ncbi:hypothetical protein R3P38DRAFT_2969618 [Favolaschia claudopus]|uniref:RNase III domain-containing protein n=1 Tax=Favolaschia claudopus TaxID=2862362 RepID=A0AAW0B4Z7_9AGAR
MAPRIHDIQSLVIVSIHGGSYRPVEPPTKTSIYSVSRRERERLEIYGDAILRERMIAYIFHKFPRGSAGFISTIQSALLSNHTFTNILLKAHGYSRPNGYPVTKSIADDFETMAALSLQECPRAFESWFPDTFVPLVNDAASLWDLANGANHDDYHFDFNYDFEMVPEENLEDRRKQTTKKSWVDSCIQAAAMPPAPKRSSASDSSKSSRYLKDTAINAQDERYARKRTWAEAMEAAGHESSNWVKAMTRASEQNTTPRPKRQGRDVHEKENHRLLDERRTRWDSPERVPKRPATQAPRMRMKELCPELEPRRRRSRWDVPPPTSDPSPPSSRPRATALQKSTQLPDSQISRGFLGSSAPAAFYPDEASVRSSGHFATDDIPIHSSEDPPIYHDGDEPWTRSGASSPMQISPTHSHTKFISLSSPRRNQVHDAPDSDYEEGPDPSLIEDGLPATKRRRSNSLISTSSSMDISACSSPTKFIYDHETPTAPSSQHGGSGSSTIRGHTRAPPLSPIKSRRATQPHTDVARHSTFFSGQTLTFTYNDQRKKPRRLII